MFQGKAIIVYGPRQSGKTTLITELLKDYSEAKVIYNGDEPDVRLELTGISSTGFKAMIGNSKIVFIDEAQRIPDIGITIKLIVDNYPDIQVIATGSSAFELTGKFKEPLTGRKYEFHLFPLSFSELAAHEGKMAEKRLLSQRLIFGCYPEVVTHTSPLEILKLLADSYLYKDLFVLEQLKKPPLLEKIVRALAYQVGNEVSNSEISRLVDADKHTVEKYISLLESAYIVFRLPALKRNLRSEIKRGTKVYFYDNGIRNSIIGNYNSLESRSDTGALWENYFVSERRKYLANNMIYANSYFWRTTLQQEIDYIEESGGAYYAYEMKWNPTRKFRISQSFLSAYEVKEIELVTPTTYDKWLK